MGEYAHRYSASALYKDAGFCRACPTAYTLSYSESNKIGKLALLLDRHQLPDKAPSDTNDGCLTIKPEVAEKASRQCMQLCRSGAASQQRHEILSPLQEPDGGISKGFNMTAFKAV